MMTAETRPSAACLIESCPQLLKSGPRHRSMFVARRRESVRHPGLTASVPASGPLRAVARFSKPVRTAASPHFVREDSLNRLQSLDANTDRELPTQQTGQASRSRLPAESPLTPLQHSRPRRVPEDDSCQPLLIRPPQKVVDAGLRSGGQRPVLDRLPVQSSLHRRVRE